MYIYKNYLDFLAFSIILKQQLYKSCFGKIVKFRQINQYQMK